METPLSPEMLPRPSTLLLVLVSLSSLSSSKGVHVRWNKENGQYDVVLQLSEVRRKKETVEVKSNQSNPQQLVGRREFEYNFSW